MTEGLKVGEGPSDTVHNEECVSSIGRSFHSLWWRKWGARFCPLNATQRPASLDQPLQPGALASGGPHSPQRHNLYMTLAVVLPGVSVSKEAPDLCLPPEHRELRFRREDVGDEKMPFFTSDAGVHGSAGAGPCGPVTGEFRKELSLHGFVSHL